MACLFALAKVNNLDSKSGQGQYEMNEPDKHDRASNPDQEDIQKAIYNNKWPSNHLRSEQHKPSASSIGKKWDSSSGGAGLKPPPPTGRHQYPCRHPRVQPRTDESGSPNRNTRLERCVIDSVIYSNGPRQSNKAQGVHSDA